MANRLRPETNNAALNHGERRTRRMPSRRRRKGAQGREPLRVVVVGASLSGLMTALAISRAGMSVTMLERTGRFPRTGAAVGLSVTVLGRLAHLEGSASIPSAFGSSPTLGATWSALHDRLPAAVEADPRIEVHNETGVQSVDQDAGGAWAVTTAARTFPRESPSHRQVKQSITLLRSRVTNWTNEFERTELWKRGHWEQAA